MTGFPDIPAAGRLVPVAFAYPVLLLLGVVDAAGYSVIGPGLATLHGHPARHRTH